MMTFLDGKLPSWLKYNKFYNVDFANMTSEDTILESDNGCRTEVPAEEANCISSVFSEGDNMRFHRPAIDLDMEAHLVPSRTPGHYHLYLDNTMYHEDYVALIEALVIAGIVNKGVIARLEKDGATFLRLPGVTE